MTEYHKIDTIYKRDPSGKQVLWGEYSRPEFSYLADNRWMFTEKVDGTNVRIMWDGETVRFNGKTDNAQMPVLLIEALTAAFIPERFAEVFDGPATLYGEGYGPKIQQGGKYRADQSCVLFDVRVGPWWLQRADVEDVAERLGVDVVPIVGWGTLADMEALVSSGFTSTWGNFPAEGVVARPETELQDRAGRRIITKLKLKDFAGMIR